MEKVPSFSLKKIADWQLNPPNDKSIELSELQRGFVWKADQIEGIWDSLLRRFPIGSFLLSTDANNKHFILDGQQRATSIALGYYDPWQSNNEYFWRLKENTPVLWIDLMRKETTTTQKYLLRLVTRSHPWGYQAVDNKKILSIAERREALNIFKENPENKDKGYTLFSSKSVFPYDSYLPVPLTFLISSINCKEKCEDWKKHLIGLCEKYLKCEYIRTKHLKIKNNYLKKLSKYINENKVDPKLFQAVKNLDSIQIPAIIIGKEILESEDEEDENEDEQTGGASTLFIRVNHSGTPISGEDTIYSMYKASFPDSKKLVESIGINFITPSLIISLAARLALSEMRRDDYPRPIGINEFRRHLKKKTFRRKLETLIGYNENSPIENIFKKVLDIFEPKKIPPVLTRILFKRYPELLLMILQWLKNKKSSELTDNEKQKILAAFTALSWFGRDNPKFVSEIWSSLSQDNIWDRKTLSRPYYHNNKYIMYPLIKPADLHDFLIDKVVNKRTSWDKLCKKADDKISEQYNKIIERKLKDITERQNLINSIWSNFIKKLVYNRYLLLFAQRDYINKKFSDFNQLETLEDTNAPWDWDHIYPESLVYNMKKDVNENVYHWTGTIGNLRAISLEENRHYGKKSPYEKLLDPKDTEDPLEALKALEETLEMSFITNDDWEQYWKKIDGRIYKGRKVNQYLKAVINRLCNIYKKWYEDLEIGTLFYFD